MSEQVSVGHRLRDWNGVIGAAIERGLRWTATAVLLAMVTLSCCDIVARYVLNSPIRGAFELTEVFLAILVFVSLPLAVRHDSHIRIDFGRALWGGKIDPLVVGVADLISAAVLTGLGYQLWEHAQKLQKYGQVTNSLEIPLSAVAYAAACLCGLSAVFAFGRLLSKGAHKPL